jgi:diadenosine tetraphosphate (Ap4A) HIT family hydrolase
MSEDVAHYRVQASGNTCPFCRVEPGRVAWSSPLVLALWDAFPVSNGHSLVVPRRHAASWQALTPDEKSALIVGVDAVRAEIDARYRPHGYNIGCNDGVAAGQTVMHVHLHVIPRYQGDVKDPRGGVRWVLGADKAPYWQGADQ